MVELEVVPIAKLKAVFTEPRRGIAKEWCQFDIPSAVEETYPVNMAVLPSLNVIAELTAAAVLVHEISLIYIRFEATAALMAESEVSVTAEEQD